MDHNLSQKHQPPASGRTQQRRPRRVQERSAETRARLVECAIECLSELGYGGATTPIIADRAGLSRGALQYHFASRTELEIAVIDHVATELNFRVDVEALRAQPLEARVDTLVETYWKAFTSSLFRAALNIWLGVLQDPPMADRLRAHLASRQDRIEATWRAVFADTGLTADELTTLRHVVMGAARGYAVELLFHPFGTGHKEKALLKQLLLHAVTNPTNEGAAEPSKGAAESPKSTRPVASSRRGARAA